MKRIKKKKKNYSKYMQNILNIISIKFKHFLKGINFRNPKTGRISNRKPKF